MTEDPVYSGLWPRSGLYSEKYSALTKIKEEKDSPERPPLLDYKEMQDVRTNDEIEAKIRTALGVGEEANDAENSETNDDTSD